MTSADCYMLDILHAMCSLPENQYRRGIMLCLLISAAFEQAVLSEQDLHLGNKRLKFFSSTYFQLYAIFKGQPLPLGKAAAWVVCGTNDNTARRSP